VDRTNNIGVKNQNNCTEVGLGKVRTHLPGCDARLSKITKNACVKNKFKLGTSHNFP
jgi:hypothetical protein